MFVLRYILFVLLVLATLRPAESSAQSEPEETYDFETYGALEAEITRIDFLRADAVDGSAGSAELVAQAIAARNETRAFLRGWIDSGTLPTEYVDYAQQADLVLAENLLHLHVEADECATANSLLEELSPLRENESDALREAYLSAVLAVEDCGERNALALGDEDGGRRGVNPGAATLVGVGAALATTGAIWNLTMLDDRNLHRELRSNCSIGRGCDARQVNALGSRIQGAQAPIAVLVIGGVAMVAGGATWWAVENRRADEGSRAENEGRQRARVTPSVDVAPGRAEATLHISFSGRR